MNNFNELFCNVTLLSQTKCTYPIKACIEYATSDNIAGRVIDGYEPSDNVINQAVLGKPAANALCEVQNNLNKMGVSLLICDAYRPRRAVLDFLAWSKTDIETEGDITRQKQYYPEHTRPELFKLGYFAEDSSHCYGNTTDVMLLDLKTNKLLDLGAPFDFMGELSHLTSGADVIGETAYQNRQTLQHAMVNAGFKPYQYEFWHFSFDGDAGKLSDTPFDEPITAEMIQQLR